MSLRFLALTLAPACAASLLVATPGTLSRSTADGPHGADVHVQGGPGLANRNFGRENKLLAKNHGAMRKIYLRFDLGGADLSLLDHVELRLTGLEIELTSRDIAEGLTFHVFGLMDGAVAGAGRLGEDWSENEITYLNGPAYSGNETKVALGEAVADGGQARFLGAFTITEANAQVGVPFTALESYVNSALLDFVRADTNGHVTFIITRTTGTNSSVAFVSKEGRMVSHAPSLRLTSR